MEIYIPCRCGCDVMVVEKIYEEGGGLFYFNMYRSVRGAGFFERIRRAWRYFRLGEFAYSDMTIETKDIDRMIDFLKTVKES